ncbi:MAG: pyridoxal-phosphate-dependent aminotransferase family protein [Candidatus Binatia bacterium]
MAERSPEAPDRLLLGPGPSNVHPRVLEALSRPLVGHLDPVFLALMEEVKALLREVFRTRNPLTFPVSGTGSAGMEACLTNLLEEGDEAVVLVNGEFGRRMADIAGRCRARAIPVEIPWGRAVAPEDVKKGLAAAKRPKLVAVVHAETSTGAWSPIEEIAPIVAESGALFVVDTVTSLAGSPVEVDAWQIDACYSGTQKCLSCPPGLSPVTFSARALEAIRGRRTPVQSWYLDLTMIEKYWGAERVYHHTAPISMNYALAAALRLVVEEGLEARFARHRRNHRALAAGLEALGFRFVVEPPERRLWMLNGVTLPKLGAAGDEASLRRRLLEQFSIEVGGGLGPFKGKIWRIGLMGESSRHENVLALLSALEKILPDAGCPVRAGAAIAAAETSSAGSEE